MKTIFPFSLSQNRNSLPLHSQELVQEGSPLLHAQPTAPRALYAYSAYLLYTSPLPNSMNLVLEGSQAEVQQVQETTQLRRRQVSSPVLQEGWLCILQDP